jgi:hypothetical protein
MTTPRRKTKKKKTRIPQHLLAAAASALGRRGGVARAKSLTPEARSHIAHDAATARWARTKQKGGA